MNLQNLQIATLLSDFFKVADTFALKQGLKPTHQCHVADPEEIAENYPIKKGLELYAVVVSTDIF